jgi:hypothetical protein
MTQNLYAYCGNNPVSMTDPTGHSYDDLWFGNVDSHGNVKGSANYRKQSSATASNAAGAAKKPTFWEDIKSFVNSVHVAAQQRNEDKFNSGGDFLNYLTFGISGSVSNGARSRYQSMVSDPSLSNVANYATVGFTGAVNRAVNPERPLSLQHWMDSAGVVMVGYAGFKIGGNAYKNTTWSGSTSSNISNDILGAQRVGSALKNDPYHAFNNIVDNYAGMATKTSCNNGMLYQLSGSYNGVAGRFEWIIDSNGMHAGQVTHRLFVAGGTMNGVPIKP